MCTMGAQTFMEKRHAAAWLPSSIICIIAFIELASRHDAECWCQRRCSMNAAWKLNPNTTIWWKTCIAGPPRPPQCHENLSCPSRFVAGARRPGESLFLLNPRRGIMQNDADETRFRLIYTLKMQNASLAWYQIFFCKAWTIQIQHIMFALGIFMFRFLKRGTLETAFSMRTTIIFFVVGV